MKYQHEELIQTTEQKDKRIEELELKHEELIQTTQQKDKRIKELELNQNVLQYDLQTKDRKIQNLESQHEEFIKNTEQKLRMMKEMKGKADFKVVDPVCPSSFCKRNIPLENMIEHMKSCCYVIFDESHLKLNTGVKIEMKIEMHQLLVHELAKSRDWFITNIRYINELWVFYIMHQSEEETKDVFYYSFKYLDDGGILQSVTVRCAPMGISVEDAVLNNFTTCIPTKHIMHKNQFFANFTMYKA